MSTAEKPKREPYTVAQVAEALIALGHGDDVVTFDTETEDALYCAVADLPQSEIGDKPAHVQTITFGRAQDTMAVTHTVAHMLIDRIKHQGSS